MTSLRYYVYVLFTAIPCALLNCILWPLFRPRKALLFSQNILHSLDYSEPDTVLDSIEIDELFEGRQIDVTIRGAFYKDYAGGTHSLKEVASLAYLARLTNPKKIFEIGTFRGRTTILLARNAPAGCKLFTLDLPQSQVSHRIGEAFANTDEAANIQQYAGDSRHFDYSQLAGSCDLVWVDACHDYDWVVHDTKSAFTLCKSGCWIAWHDYRHTAWWSGVTKHLRELKRDYPQIRHIKGTSIVVLKKP
jgi:predicted O-methyltransferase YrrM